MSTVPMDYEQAGELKIGQVGIANLRIRSLDPARLADEMAARVRRAPSMFDRAAVVLDFGGLSQVPDAATARELVEALRGAGVLPVALAYGSSDTDRLARDLGLPLLAKFRAQYERDPGAVSAPAPAAPPAAAAPSPEPPPRTTATAVAPGMVHAPLVRSGQQVYADNRDLTVLAGVGAGAEVIADGSVHIYGPLRGRALAGAQGNEQARIFCNEFHAELVAIAGHYKVMEDLPAALRGKPVQVWLQDGQLHIAPQGTQ
ncbi:septum site-determining protein MinC [Lysobacter sp. GX 14042]|uniref:septum site-determining protein MinC n=1 Tax=Lysobacter sp. GX 14042 TaxID=2907155 RepID=UPI001F319A37|nr:septum site-determining protein MinC [Lysobacter sp. GX 14042]MCE7032528.1 septum site-determining protein MinC [Lysobacter sp. GX 14042]